MATRSILAALAAVASLACGTQSPPPANTFDQVFEQRCAFGSCHAAPTLAAHLDLSAGHACEALIRVPSCLFPQRLRVVPGKLDDSFLVDKLRGTRISEPPEVACSGNSNARMPLGGEALPDDELATITDWVASGAPCETGGGGDAGVDAAPDAPGVANITVDRALALAGENLAFVVTLTAPARAGGQAVYLQAASTGLTVPLQVTVPEGQLDVAFEGFALRPTPRFAVTASSNASSRQVELRIGGLEVVEVLNDVTGPDNQLEWIKLRNASSVAIDLTRYQLRIGTFNYNTTSSPLAGMLAPGACAVIGGPQSTAVNGNPVFTQVVNFAPDLPNNTMHVKGHAVFEVDPAVAALPVDAMFVGPSNAELLDPDGRVAAPYCGDVIDQSTRRTAPTRCNASAPQPNQCP